MQDLRNLLVSVAQEQTNADNEELAVLLNSVCPSLKSSSDIAEKVYSVESLGEEGLYDFLPYALCANPSFEMIKDNQNISWNWSE